MTDYYGYDIDEIKPHLKDYLEQVAGHSKSGLYNCPVCGSGTGPHKTGALKVYEEKQLWICFACHERGDIIALYRKINNVGFNEAVEQLADMYGIKKDGTVSSQKAENIPQKAAEETKQEKQQQKDYTAQIARYAADLPGSAGERYLMKRGLTLETMLRFGLGTDGNNIIIPYNDAGEYYSKRAIVDINRGPNHYNLKGVKIPLFNRSALYQSDICFVVESPLCAISIEQCGLPAVALSGTGGGGRLLDQLKEKPALCTLLLCLDNDKAGREATPELAKRLEDAGYTCVDATDAVLGADSAGAYKDPNEELQADADELKHRLQDAAEDCRRAIKAEKQRAADARAVKAGPAAVDAFLEIVQSERYKPIPTGIREIDKAIGGGLIRQQLVLLGAAPGAGKTALAQWLFEGMAEEGRADILYINLEMSREQMLARSIARVTHVMGHDIDYIDLLQGYAWTENQRKDIMLAANWYKRDIAPHISYNPDGITADLDIITNYIEKEALEAEKAGKTAPICVIDYLQIIRGGPKEDVVETIKRAIAAFKRYAVIHNTIVFVIMATNRDSNKSGDITMESGRDTSAIEYSADLQMGLAFTRCLDRPGEYPKRRNELTDEERHYRTLKITKGRFGGEGKEVDLYFDGSVMNFIQLD